MEYNIYCDESGIRCCRYMLIGGLWVRREAEIALREALSVVRENYGLKAEMKWIKVSDKMLRSYRAFIDIILLSPDVAFKCIVLDTHIIDYKNYHNGDRDLGFYKFYYQLVSRNLDLENVYWLYTDERTSRQNEPLSTLKSTVNYWCHQKGAQHDSLRAVEARDSKADDLMQVADVLLGAVGAAWNGTATNAAKIALMSYIAKAYQRSTLATATPISCRRLNIWKWRPYSIVDQNSKKRPIS